MSFKYKAQQEHFLFGGHKTLKSLKYPCTIQSVKGKTLHGIIQLILNNLLYA